MELRDLISLIKKNAHWLVKACLFGAFFGALLPVIAQGRSTWMLDIRLTREPSSVATYFIADGYYTIETTRLFGQRLGGLLMSDAVRGQATSPGVAWGRAQRVNERDWVLSFTAKDQNNGRQALGHLQELLNQNLGTQSRESNEAFTFGAVISEPRPVMPRLNLFSGAVIGGMLGAFAVFLGILTRHYFKEPSP